MPITSNQFTSPLALSALDGVMGASFNGVAPNDASGYSVASAGDVNGDGFDDVLIGASRASPGGLSQAGSTYLIFGHRGAWNSALVSALNGSNGVVINGVAAGAQSGTSVAGAGDVNGDGFDDVLIGAPGVGSTYLIFGHGGAWNMPLALSNLNGTDGVVINGVGGSSVALAGDVNGDGIDDLLINAPYASPGGISQAGSTYLIFGHTSAWISPLVLGSLNGTNGVVINGVTAGDRSGWTVASAGDVNGDGISDVLIGTPFTFANAGSSYLIFGYKGAWSSPLLLSSLNGTNGVVINGIAAGDYSASPLASARDVNGDGFDDVVIGAQAASPGGRVNAGSTYLIFGHAGDWGMALNLLTLNGTNGVVINGIAANDRSSWSVASAGDLNGDGIDDVMIGAPNASPGGLSSAGSTYLIFGHTSAWISPLVLESLNGTNGVVINGIARGDSTGNSVASAGDVNGDGISDVLIGADGTSPGQLFQAGSTYLIFGHLGAWSSPLALSSLNGINGVVINGIAIGDRSGGSTIGAGDVNGDGIDDMLIGAYGASRGGFGSAGSAYLIFGNRPGSLNLLNNTLTINQGQTVILTNSMLAAINLGNLWSNASLPFSITNVMHGKFSTVNFNQSALSQQLVSFIHDGSAFAPSYEVTVGNWATLGPVAATISFDVPPVLYLNSFSIEQGQTVVLTNQTIRAISLYYPADALMFTVSNVLHGNFVKTNTTIIGNQFNQSILAESQIAFATDGSANAPSYDICVSDGRITTPAIRGFVTFTSAPLSPGNAITNTDAIIGGVIGVVGGLGLFFGLQWYLKKKTNEQFQKVLLAGTSDAEKAFNAEVVRPIANKIFNVINTTGFFGQRTEADTNAYMMAIGKIVSNLRRQNANLDFNAMEPVDKESFLNEIANQTRQQSLPKRKGYSFGRCTRYFKAEATPQEIEYAAEGIALASAAWQSRHMGGVSAKSTSLGLGLGKQSSIEFSNEAANEGVPPEKQFRLMQDHMKAMEQREQKQQQELKYLEERLAQQEAELAAFRRQGVMGSAS
jgi:hypothetical protein